MKKLLFTIVLLAGLAGCTPKFPLLCDIKGNVAAGRLYHLPGQPTYERTKVNPERGDRVFCTETDAQAAGFTKAKR